MATFTSPRAASGINARFLHEGTVTESAAYSASATLTAGDVIQMVKIPAGARVIQVELSSNRLSHWPTGLSVGDGVDVDRYIASAGVTTAYRLQNFAYAGAGGEYEYTADDTVDITIDSTPDRTIVATDTGNIATASAIFRMTVMYHCDRSTVK